MHTHNYMKHIIAEVVTGALKQRNLCGCKTCKTDITEKILTLMSPKYDIDTTNVTFMRTQGMDIQIKTDVILEFVNFIKEIENNPCNIIK